MSNSSENNFAGLLVERLGKNSCLIDAATGETFAGNDLTGLIFRFAAGFLSSGLRTGDRLLIGCSVSPASTIAYLGAMYAGLVPIPVEQRLLLSSGDSLLAKARPKAVWTEGGGWHVSGRNSIPHFQGNFGPADARFLPATPRAEQDLAALMPTSGSTGIPRLVMVSHGNLTANTEAIIRSQHMGADEKAMLVMPVSYCFGASVMHTHLFQGGGVVFDSRFMFPDKVLQATNDFACTTFAGVPAVYNILARRSNLKSIPLPGLRRFLQAGGALAPATIHVLRDIVPTADFFVMYGQTEGTARISCLPAEHLAEKLGSAGLPLDNLEIRIVDENGRELLNGEIGEIQVRGPSVCAGYFDDPESTERKFADGWLRTGDFACRDDEGFLWIKGRTDDFIKIRGYRVSVGEVEAKVAAIPGVYECAATAVDHAETGEALALFIVPEEGVAGHSVDGLAERVRRALPPKWTCSSVSIVDNLPRTTNGKIARSQLQTMV